ncbi:MAG: hypothetical protein ACOY93_05310 [Bacillota bacterium]
MRRVSVYLLMMLLFLTASAGLASGPVTAAASIPEFQADVIEYIKSRPRSAKYSEDYRLPKSKEVSTFQQVVSLLASGDTAKAASLAGRVNYRVAVLNDTARGKKFWVLEETASSPREHQPLGLQRDLRHGPLGPDLLPGGPPGHG